MDIPGVLNAILDREGGYAHHPLDRGGETAFGISQAAYPELVIKTLTRAQAYAIYEQDYIHRPGLDKITDPALLAQVADFAIHSGSRTALQHLQRLMGMTEIDGIMGPDTLAALQAADPQQLNTELVKARCLYLARLCVATPSQLAFLAGWLTRALSFL